MKHTSKILIALLVLATMLMSLTVISASAEDNSPVEYKFDATTDVAVGADKDTIAEDTTYADGYFTVSGKVTQRVKSEAVYAVELEKNELGSIDFTVTADHTAVVTIEVSSTGTSNTSAFGIVDSNGLAVTESSQGLIEVTGTSKITASYNLTAGEYSIVSPSSDYGRGFRLHTISVVESVASCDHNYVNGLCSKCSGKQEGYFAEYEFSGEDVAVGTDKDAITAGTTYENGFFTTVGTITQRVKNEAVYAVELGKDGTGAILFNVDCYATVVVQFASTGSSNTSVFGIVDVYGDLVANNEELTEVTGTTNVTVSYALKSGTYRVVSPFNAEEGKDRGVRVASIKVTTQKCDHTFAENDICTQCNALNPEHVHSYENAVCSVCKGLDAAYQNALVEDNNLIVINGDFRNTAGYFIENVLFTVTEKANYSFMGSGVLCWILNADYTEVISMTGSADLDVGNYWVCISATTYDATVEGYFVPGPIGTYNVAVTKTAIVEEEIPSLQIGENTVTITGNITNLSGNAVEWYKLEVTTAGTYAIVSDDISGFFYSEIDDTLVSKCICGFTGVVALEPGTYYVLLGRDNKTGDFKVTVDNGNVEKPAVNTLVLGENKYTLNAPLKAIGSEFITFKADKTGSYTFNCGKELIGFLWYTVPDVTLTELGAYGTSIPYAWNVENGEMVDSFTVELEEGKTYWVGFKFSAAEVGEYNVNITYTEPVSDTVEEPTEEPELNLFQKILKAVKDFFANIGVWFKNLFAKK